MKKIIAAVAVLFLLTAPAFAVFNEKSLNQTLSLLKCQLKTENDKLESYRKSYRDSGKHQHEKTLEIISRCNELSLVLYSQWIDYTFDVTYALEEVTNEYEDYTRQRKPLDELIEKVNLEIERYQHLVASLKNIPPVIPDYSDIPDSPCKSDSLVMSLDSLSLLNIDLVKSDAVKFQLDSAGIADRDSCFRYASNLLLMYVEFRDGILQDAEKLDEAKVRLQESYDYAQEKYKFIQNKIFREGGENYLALLSRFSENFSKAIDQVAEKYGMQCSEDDIQVIKESEWHGDRVLGFAGGLLLLFLFSVLISLAITTLVRKFFKLSSRFSARIPIVSILLPVLLFSLALMVWSLFTDNHFFSMASRLTLNFSWLVIAILMSLIIRSSETEIKNGIRLYVPITIMGLIIIVFRLIFIPNMVVSLFFPPLLLIFVVWQHIICSTSKGKSNTVDLTLGWISYAIMLCALIMSLVGFVLLSIQLFIWWLFQISAITSIIAIDSLLRLLYDKKLEKKVVEYQKSNKIFLPQLNEHSHAKVTWFYDLLKSVVVPLLALSSIPLCLWFASDVFDLTSVCDTIFHKPFLDLKSDSGDSILRMSFFSILIAVGMYFVFRYLNYLAVSFYSLVKVERYRKQSGHDVIRANEINLTLSKNVISILVWGVYVITLVLMLKIPVGALSIVMAGLATGLGLAMKDLLNNVIYGIQLMSGRLRVGDFIECDNFRGKVSAISYQSTQIETIEGAVVSFLNADLFSRNFKNLTRNDSYEFLNFNVGVAYGTDVDTARSAIIKALEPLANTMDNYGRPFVDPIRGIVVAFDSFGDSSVNLVVKQFVLVSEKGPYKASAQELIYNALNDVGIEIPFPQLDIHQR